MNVTYTPAAKQDEDNYTLMQLATQFLEQEFLGAKDATVTAVWDQTADAAGKQLYTLHLRDATGNTAYQFTPADLRTRWYMNVRLRLLWDDLLRIALHKQLAEMHAGD